MAVNNKNKWLKNKISRDGKGGPGKKDGFNQFMDAAQPYAEKVMNKTGVTGAFDALKQHKMKSVGATEKDYDFEQRVTGKNFRPKNTFSEKATDKFVGAMQYPGKVAGSVVNSANKIAGGVSKSIPGVIKGITKIVTGRWKKSKNYYD